MSGHLAIAAILGASADLHAIVGDRIYPDLVPSDNPFPAVTFIRVSGQRKRRARSVSQVLKERFQVTSIGKTREQALQVAAAVKSSLVGTRGTFGGVEVRGCWCEDEGQDLSDPETKTRLVAADFRIWTVGQ